MNMLREDSQLQVQYTKVTEPPLTLQATPTPKQVSSWRKRQLNTQSPPPPQPDCPESFSICALLTLSGWGACERALLAAGSERCDLGAAPVAVAVIVMLS